jgi:hypothetical protein
MSWPVILIGLAILFGIGVIYAYRPTESAPARSEIVYLEDEWLPWDWTSGWAGNYVNAGGWWPHDRNNYRPHHRPHPGPRPGPRPGPGPMVGPGGTQRMFGPGGTQRMGGTGGGRQMGTGGRRH